MPTFRNTEQSHRDLIRAVLKRFSLRNTTPSPIKSPLKWTEIFLQNRSFPCFNLLSKAASLKRKTSITKHKLKTALTKYPSTVNTEFKLRDK